MDTIEAILTRRSIRKFKSQKIDNVTLESILKAAMYAPSARNTQSWQFVVISDKEVMKSIMKVHPYSSMLADASHAILVCADKQLEPNEGYCNQNCSAATQNMLLAAHALGIGSVWLGVYPREERMNGISKVFELPGHIMPISLIALGYPAEKHDTPDRYKPDRVHFEKW